MYMIDKVFRWFFWFVHLVILMREGYPAKSTAECTNLSTKKLNNFSVWVKKGGINGFVVSQDRMSADK